MHMFFLSRQLRCCFNRYMVECEFENTQSGAVIDSVLIDTWWNVNFFKSPIPLRHSRF